jgi:CRISPR-associated protein Csm5
MGGYLKRFRVTLKTKSPVHIGSGETIERKQYIKCKIADGITEFDSQDKNALFFPEPTKVYGAFEEAGKTEEYEKYLMDPDDTRELGALCHACGVRVSDSAWRGGTGYTLSLSKLHGKDVFNEIHAFVKDAWGQPYIPGSSLKGALRNIIMSDLIASRLRDASAQGELQDISRRVKELDDEELVKIVMRGEYGLGRHENGSNAVNDIMSAVRISDSEPLALDQLTICQKIDKHVSDGKRRTLPTFRECLKPNVEVRFDMTVDHSLFGKSKFDSNYFSKKILWNIKMRDGSKRQVEKTRLEMAISRYAEEYDKGFRRRFSPKKLLRENDIYIGGGSGFYTKTVLLMLLDDKTRLDFVSSYMEKAAPDHKHEQDRKLGVSPHTIKETYFESKSHEETDFKDKPYEMGLCGIWLEEVPE